MATVVPVAKDVDIRMSQQRPPDHDALQRFAEERALRGSIERLEAAMEMIR